MINASSVIRGRRLQQGLTLIELMVALVLSLLIGIAILFAQRMLVHQNTRQSDVALRDSEARAAMDLVAHDLSGAGFLFGGSQLPCSAIFTSNQAVGGGGGATVARLPADAYAASSGATMTFAQNLQLNYPPAGSGIASDLLVITGATGADNFNDSKFPLINISPNGGVDPMANPVLPLVSTVGLTAGHVAMVMVPDSGQNACLRVPVSQVGLAGGVPTMTSTGALMPAAAYTGFAPLMTPNGFKGPLSKAEIFQGRVVDLGDPLVPTQTATAFYIDSAVAQWPTLMRSTYSLLDDTPIGTPQPIAAGVMSFQVLFGVDPANTGLVTAYETGAQMRAAIHQLAIRSVRVAIVARSLYPDADFTNPQATVAIGGGFAAVPIPVAYQHHRFTVQRAEVAVRNCLWQSC